MIEPFSNSRLYMANSESRSSSFSAGFGSAPPLMDKLNNKSFRFAPHSGQKFFRSMLREPHLGHCVIKRAPQCSQNFEVGMFF